MNRPDDRITEKTTVLVSTYNRRVKVVQTTCSLCFLVDWICNGIHRIFVTSKYRILVCSIYANFPKSISDRSVDSWSSGFSSKYVYGGNVGQQNKLNIFYFDTLWVARLATQPIMVIIFEFPHQMVFVLNATYTAFFLYTSALMAPHLISSGKTLLNDRLDNLPLYLTTKKKVSWHTSTPLMHLLHIFLLFLLRTKNWNDIFYRAQHVCLHRILLRNVRIQTSSAFTLLYNEHLCYLNSVKIITCFAFYQAISDTYSLVKGRQDEKFS